MRKIKIGYITELDAKDKTSYSGSINHIFNLLNKYCGEVVLIDRLKPQKFTVKYLIMNWLSVLTWIFIFGKMVQFICCLFGKNFLWERTPWLSRYYSQKIKTLIRNKHIDVIFTDKGTLCLAYLKTATRIPIIHESDGTFQLLVGSYPEYKSLIRKSISWGNQLEKRALDNADRCVFTSSWAANSAIADYKVKPEKVRVINYPLMFDNPLAKENLLFYRDDSICNLLFVGVDWERKGGDLAVAIVDALNGSGLKSKLVICGCMPPEYVKRNMWVSIKGFLDKNIDNEREELKRLYLNSTFFLLPSKADCFASAITEAFAFGLPPITTDVGAHGEIIKNGINGFILSPNSAVDEYVKVIKDAYKNKEIYEILVHNARITYEQKFSEESWAKKINQIIDELLFDLT